MNTVKSIIPVTAKRLETNIVQFGEHTNHCHELYDGEFEMYQDSETMIKFLKVITPTMLKHQEHKPIVLPPGEYKVGIVKEYSPFEKLTRAVQD